MNNFLAHILVVDDDDGIRKLVKQFLNENNYLVSTPSAQTVWEDNRLHHFQIP